MFVDTCPAQMPISEQFVRPFSKKRASEPDFLQDPENLVTVYNLKWTILCAEAKHSENAEDYAAAKEYWSRALAVCSEFNTRDSRVVKTLRSLATLHYRLGEYVEAEYYSLREAEHAHRTFGINHLRSSNSLNLLGAIYFAQGSFSAAEMCLYQVLRVHSMCYGLEDRRTMQAAQSLAILLNKQGKRELAVQYFLQALQISEKVDDGQGSFRATIVSQIASV